MVKILNSHVENSSKNGATDGTQFEYLKTRTEKMRRSRAEREQTDRIELLL